MSGFDNLRRVYILTTGEYDSFSIMGVYATLEAAQAAHPGEWTEREPGSWDNHLVGQNTADITEYEIEGGRRLAALVPEDEEFSHIWWDPETGAERHTGEPRCNGQCLTGADILYPADGVSPAVLAGVAYPSPSCPAHGDVDPWPDERVAAEAQEDQRASLMDAYSRGATDLSRRQTPL